MGFFFLIAPQACLCCLVAVTQLPVPVSTYLLSPFLFLGLGSWCSWMLVSCLVSSFFHIRIAYHSAFANGSFSNWQFIYLQDYLPRRHTFTCFPGLLTSAFWSSLPFFCSFHSFLFSEQRFYCFMVAFTQIAFYLHIISIRSSLAESNLNTDIALRFSVV